jgi:hypothetical protein
MNQEETFLSERNLHILNQAMAVPKLCTKHSTAASSGTHLPHLLTPDLHTEHNAEEYQRYRQ